MATAKAGEDTLADTADEACGIDMDKARISRRNWKGAVTRHLGNLERHMADDDVEALSDRLQKIKVTYEQFEVAHYMYHDMLKDDKDYDESELWFDKVRQNYIQQVAAARKWLKEVSHPPASSVSYVSNPVQSGIIPAQVFDPFDPLKSPSNVFLGANNDSTKKDDLISTLSSIPRIEIPKFSGDVLEFESFMATFDELIHTRSSDDQMKLTRLLQYTEGSAHQSIKFTALVGGTKGYLQAREILRTRYGNKHVVSQKVISVLKNGPSVSKSNDILLLADEIKAGHTTLNGLGMDGEINSQQCIQDILKRFPIYVKNKWKKHALKHRKNQDSYPSFDNFVEFISEVASDASDPVYGNKSPENDSQNNSKKGSGLATDTNQASGSRKTGKGSNGAPGTTRQCVLCNAPHDIFHCDQFRSMTPSARLDIAKQKWLCFLCLENHRVSQCPHTNWKCSVCSGRHSKWLHIDKRKSNQNYNTPSGSTADQSGSTPNKPITNTSTGMSRSHVCLPLVKVRVNNECDVLALCDSGSTSSFISEELALRLKLKGQKVQYQMSTLSAQDQQINVKVVSVNLNSSFAPKPVTIKNVLVIPEIPARAPGFDIDIEDYPHLSDLPIVYSSLEKAQILIGNDNSDLLIPREIRSNVDVPKQPYATLTYFGWTISGIVGAVNDDISAMAVSNCVNLHDINDLWQDDDLDDHSVAMSREDKKVMEFWEQNTLREDGHYVIPIPFRQNCPNFPDNYSMAHGRLKSLVYNLKKRNLYERYDEAIQSMLLKGYAESDPDPCQNDESTWFLPHFPVVNEVKNKVRPVHDCRAVFKDVSFNNQVYQGPDLNNKLIDVLLRFRQYSYAMTCDIREMYMQVKFPADQRRSLKFLWIENDMVRQFRMCSHIFGGKFCASSSAYALKRAVQDSPSNPSNLVIRAINYNCYVDDLLDSEKSRADMCEVAHGSKIAAQYGGFEICV